MYLPFHIYNPKPQKQAELAQVIWFKFSTFVTCTNQETA